MHYLRTLHREVIFIGLSPFSIVIWRRFNFPRFFCVADFRSIMSSGKKKKKTVEWSFEGCFNNIHKYILDFSIVFALIESVSYLTNTYHVPF